MTEKTTHTILSHTYRYLASRPRTRGEVHTFLTKKASSHDWAEDDIAAAERILEEEGHINDVAFIDWYVQARSIKKFKSVFAITQELRRLGLSDDTIQDYFSTHQVDEQEQATELLKRKWRTYERETPQNRKRKAYQYLASKGYSHDIIRNALARIEDDMYNI